MLSDMHRQAIVDAIGDRKVDLEQVFLQLERIYEGYQALERDRELNPPNKARGKVEARDLILELITLWRGDRDNLHTQLSNYQHHTVSGLDEIEQELCRMIQKLESELTTLEAMQRYICSHIDNLDAEVRKFRGNSKPHRENMYAGLLRVWTDIIGGELKFNRPPPGGQPYGPLIDFLHACLTPILGDKMRSTHGIADIIDRVRNPERHAKRKKRKPT
jgi:hypothetical protein